MVVFTDVYCRTVSAWSMTGKLRSYFNLFVCCYRYILRFPKFFTIYFIERFKDVTILNCWILIIHIKLFLYCSLQINIINKKKLHLHRIFYLVPYINCETWRESNEEKSFLVTLWYFIACRLIVDFMGV